MDVVQTLIQDTDNFLQNIVCRCNMLRLSIGLFPFGTKRYCCLNSVPRKHSIQDMSLVVFQSRIHEGTEARGSNVWDRIIKQ